MKGFFYGLTAGLAAGIAAQMMIAKNHEQMLELVRNFPRPRKFGPKSSLEDLMVQKEVLENLIKKKQNEEEAEFEMKEEKEGEEENEDFSDINDDDF